MQWIRVGKRQKKAFAFEAICLIVGLIAGIGFPSSPLAHLVGDIGVGLGIIGGFFTVLTLLR